MRRVASAEAVQHARTRNVLTNGVGDDALHAWVLGLCLCHELGNVFLRYAITEGGHDG